MTMNNNDDSLSYTRDEQRKIRLIERELQKSIPLIAVCCAEGVLFATAVGMQGVEKVRIVHPAGLVFGGVGEAIALNQIASGLIMEAHHIEYTSGHESVDALSLISVSERGGVLGAVRTAFRNARTLPIICDFVLADVRGFARLHYVSATGERDCVLSFLVLGPEEKVKIFQDKLGGRIVPHISFAEAKAIIAALWQDAEPDREITWYVVRSPHEHAEQWRGQGWTVDIELETGA